MSAAVVRGTGAEAYVPWVRIDRENRPEAFHAGALVVLDDGGTVRAQLGNPDARTYLRSSVKMMQALPLVDSGAADAFGLGTEHLALACASHAGESFHVDGVREMLRRCGRTEADLHCGPHPPEHAPSAEALARGGGAPQRVHNGCSGKHAGMIATCVHRGWPAETYWQGDHPLQVEIRRMLGLLSDVPPERIPFAVDGCGVPTFFVSLREFARAGARYVAGTGPARALAPSALRLASAMRTHPENVAGTGRFCTMLMRASSTPLLAKGGAEGLYLVAWRDGDHGVAMVAKAGAGDSRSVNFAVAEALHQLGVLDDEALAQLAEHHRGPVRNWAGDVVGERHALFDLRR
jgi:L-asparaginase II